MTVLDLGAGRGTKLLGPEDFVSRLVRLQGKVRKVIGIDVDEAIYEHPYLDERHVFKIGDKFPLKSASVDLVVCEWVLEHVAEPQSFADEVERVLKPGGWFCARTPSKWSYVGLAAKLIPNAFHVAVLSRLWPERAAEDVFPTVYRLNTMSDIKYYFPRTRWGHCSYSTDAPPKYHANSGILFRAFDIFQHLSPSGFKTEMIVLLQKGIAPSSVTRAAS
jgi:SAM-dependent methyltransferase